MRKLRRALIAGLLGLAAAPAMADAYHMGAGRWSCAEAIQVFETGTPSEQGQLTGWILGFWSAVTAAREGGFVKTVEQVGGPRIAQLTLDQCRKAPPDTPLWTLTTTMIANTK